MFDVKGKVNYKSFTLAEVLITLAIIGVVAALTIPSIMQKTQKQEYVIALKKFYANTNQVLAEVANEECSPGTIACFKDQYDAMSSIAKHFKKSKDCGFSTSGDCGTPTAAYFDGSSVSMLTNFSESDKYKFISVDGMSVAIWISSNICTNSLSGDPMAPTRNYCGDLTVDINGKKPPNAQGRDVFKFRITSNKSVILYPYGGKYDDHYWNDGSSAACTEVIKQGQRCTGRIMEEGWEMNY